MTQTMPEGVTVEMLDAVTEEMNVKSDPPAGLVVHVHYEDGGRTYVVDVWDSAQAFETFAEQRLGPAMQKVAERHGSAMPEPNSPEMREVHEVVRGR